MSVSAYNTTIHNHVLALQLPDGRGYRNGWRCNGCKTSHEYGLKSFNCAGCSFDLCSDCIEIYRADAVGAEAAAVAWRAKEKKEAKEKEKERPRKNLERMLSVVQGRDAFDLIPALPKEQPLSILPTKSLLLAMLQREQQLRLSPQTQDLYAVDKNHGAITRDLQEQVAREFGFVGEHTSAGVALLRGASSMFPDDLDIKDASFYRKHNKSNRGALEQGAAFPSGLQVHAMDGQLHELIPTPQDHPTVLVAGSYS